MTIVEVFCGAESCYDVLKVEKDCTAKDIKKVPWCAVRPPELTSNDSE